MIVNEPVIEEDQQHVSFYGAWVDYRYSDSVVLKLYITLYQVW